MSSCWLQYSDYIAQGIVLVILQLLNIEYYCGLSHTVELAYSKVNMLDVFIVVCKIRMQFYLLELAYSGVPVLYIQCSLHNYFCYH